MDQTLKSLEQQRIEKENGGRDIREILVAELERLSGRPHMVAQIANGMKISDPTLRKWCVDFGIEVKVYL